MNIKCHRQAITRQHPLILILSFYLCQWPKQNMCIQRTLVFGSQTRTSFENNLYRYLVGARQLWKYPVRNMWDWQAHRQAETDRMCNSYCEIMTICMCANMINRCLHMHLFCSRKAIQRSRLFDSSSNETITSSTCKMTFLGGSLNHIRTYCDPISNISMEGAKD